MDQIVEPRPTSSAIGSRLFWRLHQTRLGCAVARGSHALLLAVGVTSASIPAADGTINGCYDKNSGKLRVIDAPGVTCDNNETAIIWSQTGPARPPGPQGPAGPAGAVIQPPVSRSAGVRRGMHIRP